MSETTERVLNQRVWMIESEMIGSGKIVTGKFDYKQNATGYSSVLRSERGTRWWQSYKEEELYDSWHEAHAELVRRAEAELSRVKAMVAPDSQQQQEEGLDEDHD
jgi:hypothetical protein